LGGCYIRVLGAGSGGMMPVFGRARCDALPRSPAASPFPCTNEYRHVLTTPRPQSTLFNEYFDAWLRPYEHYIPVLPDLSDLVNKVLWARENDGEARRIQAGCFFVGGLIFSPAFIHTHPLPSTGRRPGLRRARAHGRAERLLLPAGAARVGAAVGGRGRHVGE
jgi:hypothetical protein